MIARRELLALLLVAACKDTPAPPPPPPPIATTHDAAVAPAWDDGFEADVSRRWIEIYELRKQAKALRQQAEGERAWPSVDVADLDFTATGNAIITFVPGDEMREVMLDAPRFRIIHREHDPVRIAEKARPYVTDHATYRSAKYRPMIELLLRAKYVVIVLGEYTWPTPVLEDVPPDSRGRFNGLALLYEIASQQLLSAFPIAVENRAGVKAKTGNIFKGLAPLVLDLESVARDALWASLSKRYPTAKLPAIVYLEAEYE